MAKKGLPSLRVFVSYYHKDKSLAGRIRNELDNLGLVVFLAHDDIRPSEPWQERILIELNRCGAFLPLLTKRFRRSKWTDQETGIAIGGNRVVVPIKVGINPYGFAARFQAFPLAAGKKLRKSCAKLFEMLRSNGRLRFRATNSLINAFGQSGDFLESRDRSALLLKCETFTRPQLKELLRVSDRNDQIYKCTPAFKNLSRILRRNKRRIDQIQLSRLRHLDFPFLK